MAKQWKVTRRYWTKEKRRGFESGCSESTHYTGAYNDSLAVMRTMLAQWDRLADGTIAGTKRTPKTVARVYNSGDMLTTVYIEVKPC